MDIPEIYKGFIRGSIAGITAGIITHPIDLIKVRMQINQGKISSVSQVGYNIYKNEGVLSLYKGLSASVMRQGSFIGIKFGIYEIWKKNIKKDNSNLNFPEKIAGGFVSGGFASVVSNPFDLSMVRMQADNNQPKHLRRNYTSGLNAISRIIREEGILTLWRGSSPTFARSCIITATQLGVYEEVKERLIQTKYFNDGLATYTLSSFICSVLSGLVSNPFDIAKTRLMNMDSNKKVYRGTVHVMTSVVKNEGLLALTKGVKPAIMRQVPINLIRFSVVEFLKKVF